MLQVYYLFLSLIPFSILYLSFSYSFTYNICILSLIILLLFPHSHIIPSLIIYVYFILDFQYNICILSVSYPYPSLLPPSAISVVQPAPGCLKRNSYTLQNTVYKCTCLLLYRYKSFQFYMINSAKLSG